VSRRALVVGIDDYANAPLSGCVKDAIQIANLLRRHEDGTPNFEVQLLTSDTVQISRAILRESIETLFQHDVADVALFYFAGHGTIANLEGYLVTTDAEQYDEGVELSFLLTHANRSRATEVVVILDSCMSGALGAIPALGGNRASISEGVSILTASRSSQAAVEEGGRGVFTELVCGGLEGGAADVLGNVNPASIYAYVEEALGAWDQRPLFKIHVSKLLPLRKTKPAVPLETLRKISVWFNESDSEFPLDPSFEDTNKLGNTENETIFKCLQKCRDAKLVEAVGEEFMYFAAQNSKSCKLTALGKHYWRLAKAGRI
jgi:hypothetical protein